MQLCLFTKRERAFMKGVIDGIPQNDESINLDPLKMAVAKRFPMEEWDEWYAKALVVTNDLITLAEYNTCKRLEGWTWETPGTPTKLYPMDKPDSPINIVTVAHPESLDEHLRSLWDRPREELRTLIEIIQDAGKFYFIEWVCPDKNRLFWRLTWVAGVHHNRNIVYLVRK